MENELKAKKLVEENKEENNKNIKENRLFTRETLLSQVRLNSIPTVKYYYGQSNHYWKNIKQSQHYSPIAYQNYEFAIVLENITNKPISSIILDTKEIGIEVIAKNNYCLNNPVLENEKVFFALKFTDFFIKNTKSKEILFCVLLNDIYDNKYSQNITLNMDVEQGNYKFSINKISKIEYLQYNLN